MYIKQSTLSSFQLYFAIGLEHILDIKGYDHILFVLALCAVFTWKDWRKILVLVTAFTIGHSITLTLVTFDWITINSDLIEFLIPVTIFVTAFQNVFPLPFVKGNPKIPVNYLFALFFGFIHGMGFSNYLKAVMGKSASVTVELLAFNLGLEAGQVIIVLFYLLLSFIFVQLLHLNKLKWLTVTSSMIMGMSLLMIIESKFW